MLKISSQYLEGFQIHCQLTERFWQLPAYVCRKQANSYKRRRAIARIFQLNDHNSETAQDIDLKFSAFVHHMSGLNWLKNFSNCSIGGSIAPFSMQKLSTPLATIFVEKKIWKNFGVVLCIPIQVNPLNFWYLEKNGVLKFLGRVRHPEPVVHALL